MLLIPCPYCGTRDEPEFRFGGEYVPAAAGSDAPSSDTSWSDRFFNRRNVRGEARERWVHWAGCGRWFILVRDTVTHRIYSSHPLQASPDATEKDLP